MRLGRTGNVGWAARVKDGDIQNGGTLVDTSAHRRKLSQPQTLAHALAHALAQAQTLSPSACISASLMVA
jgi:hypothetical protein